MLKSKVLVFLLLLALLLTSQAGAQELRLLGFEPTESNRVWSDNRFFERMQDITGIGFTFSQYGDLASYREKLNGLSKLDADLPQVLFKAMLSPIQAQDLLDRGVIVDLAPYLQEHAPDFYALMEAQPELRRAITLADGSIPALPNIAQTTGQNPLWINRAWLEELKLPVPTNLEDFISTLSAFKTRDPNRNGRNDEIPLSFIGPYDLKYLAHAWGLVANDFNLFVQEGQVRFMPLEAGFEAFIREVSALYADGLMDRDGFTQVDSLRRVTDAKSTKQFGAFFSPLPTNVVPSEWTADYSILLPLTHKGQRSYRAVASPFTYGAFALTTACDNIPGMLAWVNHLYTQEGAILAAIGKEGEDYVFDGDGSWRLLREAGDRQYFTDVIIATDQATPGITTEDFQARYSDPLVRSLTEQSKQLSQVSVLPFPDIPLTQEEASAIAPLQAALGRYVDEAIARFVLGEWATDDAQFAAFREELYSLGLSQFLALWQGMYDRGMNEHGL